MMSNDLDIGFPARILVTLSGRSGIRVDALERHSSLRSEGRDGYCYEFRVTPRVGADREFVQVAVGGFTRTHYQPDRFGLETGGDEGLVELSMVRLGVQLDRERRDWFHLNEGGKVPRLWMDLEELDDLPTRSSREVARYAIGKAFWAFEFGFDEVEITPADRIRMGAGNDAFRKTTRLFPELLEEGNSAMGIVRLTPTSQLLHDLPAGRVPGIEVSPVHQVQDRLRAEGFDTPASHFQKAVNFLTGSDQDLPNAVKEAASAFESLLRILSGEESKSVGKIIRKLQSKNVAHPAVLSAIEKMWGYASNVAGARHGSASPPDVPQEEATFTVNMCANAILLLLSLSDKIGS